jgi:hypothetical protein
MSVFQISPIFLWKTVDKDVYEVHKGQQFDCPICPIKVNNTFIYQAILDI